MASISLGWFLLLLVCAGIGLVVAYRLGVASLRPTVAALSNQIAGRERLTETLDPLREAMLSLQQRVDDAERSRVAGLSRLSEQVLGVQRQVGTATAEVQTEARRISQALARTQHQGMWGEMQLRRLVEASGMLAHVHFAEQVRLADGSLRPDMVIDLGNERSVVVDAKVSLDALLNDQLGSEEQATAHAAAVADHLSRLSAKQYWRAAGSPEFVIMFLPAEHMLGVALQARPGLLQQALDQRVVLATPTTLMATLSSIAWAWQQADMAGHAREVLEAGKVVHERLSTLAKHLSKLGRDLTGAVEGYNMFVGSLEARVLPATRRLGGLYAPSDPSVETAPIDVRPREMLDVDTG